MKAEDTVMTTEDVLVELRKLSDDEWLKVIKSIHPYGRKLQAEISFKAGQDDKATQLLVGIPNAIAQARKNGIKEVVDWIENNNVFLVHPDNRVHFLSDWQSQLKEWGIE